MDLMEEPDDFVYYGNSLTPLGEDEISGKKPIRIEDQIVTDENGRRRFHGAFTGGFSAGYYNTVDTKEGWRPKEFKSSRTERKKHEQKPEDYMDQEDLGSFGFAPQVLRAKEDFGENQVSKKRVRTVLAPKGAIPGLPALHNLFQPVKETIGIKLLRSMGWKPNQGVGRRLTKKEKRERKTRERHIKAYSCQLPTSLQRSDGEESDEDSPHLFAPDDVPTFIVQPKTNTFGLGYSGLVPREDTLASKRGFVLFEPTLSLTDKKKKLQIAGQAFGVGAFENEDEDIYAKDDLSRYDFELGSAPTKKNSQKLLALPCSDILDGFVRPSKPEPMPKAFAVPYLPRDFVPIHRSQKSRFDVKPMSETELRGLGRHDLNAYQRAAILNQVLDVSGESCVTLESEVKVEVSQPAPTSSRLTADEIVAQALIQIRKTVAAQQQEKASQAAAKQEKIPPVAVDPNRESKVAELKSFVQRSLTISSFQPFSRDPSKQFRFDAYNILSKASRLDEFHLIQPETMTEWEREREKVEFERSLSLYRPLTGTMQNRFTSGGHVEENIQGGLVAQIDSFLPEQGPKPKKEPTEKDPAKRAALRKHFGPLTRKRSQWKPDRLLCIRFNVPNPFSDSAASQSSAKPLLKGSGQKFSIFDVLNEASHQSGPSFVSGGMENSVTSEVKELEWDKAERGEPIEKSENQVAEEMQVPIVKQEEVEAVPEETVYQRPPMDLFKAIFEQSDSEEDEAEEEVEEQKETTVVQREKRIDQRAQDEHLEEEMQEDVYGPRIPTTTVVSSPVAASLSCQNESDEDWVEKATATSKRKKEKKKKSKNKKDKKNKKKKRRHSDSSSSSDEDVKILKKILTLKKKQKL